MKHIALLILLLSGNSFMFAMDELAADGAAVDVGARERIDDQILRQYREKFAAELARQADPCYQGTARTAGYLGLILAGLGVTGGSTELAATGFVLFAFASQMLKKSEAPEPMLLSQVTDSSNSRIFFRQVNREGSLYSLSGADIMSAQRVCEAQITRRNEERAAAVLKEAAERAARIEHGEEEFFDEAR